ncbi:hypothetical protein WR25_11555 [Diploscapter pachys]|uniref:Uncharacterized protein n=1 Tax=Diploscapter pachys TaxID=2018661 RepID=A0A2A2JPZ4_9BILA|nr:hypothetical protein WR25_11555 [Diploscapter pachys]
MSDQNPDPPIATITPAQAEEGHSKPAPKEKSKVFTELTDEEMQAALPHLLIYYGVLLIIASNVKNINSAVRKGDSKTAKNVVTAILLILYVIIVIVHIYGLYLIIDVFFREDPVCSRVLQWFSFLVFVVASFFLAFVCCCISGMGCLYCMRDKILEWAERNGVPPETLDKYRKTINQNQN